MELVAHWASDVVAGALTCVTAGNSVSELGRSEAHGGHCLALRPLIGPGLVGVNGLLSW